MQKIIILVVGLPGSGKTSVSNHIKEKFGAAVLKSGDVIRDEIKRRGWKYTTETDAEIAEWFHTREREKMLVRRLWAKMKRSRKKIIVIDGFRVYENYTYLRKIAKREPFIIAVSSSTDVRVKRLLKRHRFGKDETRKYIKSRDKQEKRHGVMRLVKRANYKINNDKLSRRQTNARISKIIKEIISK